MSLHDELLNELLYGNVVLTPREVAAKNELLKLRGKPAQQESNDVPAEAEVSKKAKLK